MEAIDRKYRIAATSLKSGNKYSQSNAVLFVAHDQLLPDLLEKYYELAKEKGADTRQLEGIHLLKERIMAWQERNLRKVKLPDVEEGKEEKRVCKANSI